MDVKVDKHPILFNKIILMMKEGVEGWTTVKRVKAVGG